MRDRYNESLLKSFNWLTEFIIFVIILIILYHLILSMEPKPIKFVAIDSESGSLSVTNEAMGFLGSLPSDQKLSILNVVGPSKTGKSFLANKIL